MGEAKRRKQLDPNYGKPKERKESEPNYRKPNEAFVECKPGLTPLGNYGIYCGLTGHLVDSASTKEASQKCCDYINQQLLKFPLINPTLSKWGKWCMEHQEWTPDANMLELFRGKN